MTVRPLRRIEESARWRLRRLIGWQPYPPVETPPCALCGRREATPVASRMAHYMRYTTVVCRGCGLVFISPRPSPHDFERYYEELFFLLYTGRRRIDSVAPSAESIHRGRSLFDFLGVPARGLLDIGCGDGGTLAGIAERLTEEGAPPVVLAGCDPGRGEDAPRLIEWAGRAIRLSPDRIEDLGLELEQFDVLVLFDVLEHLLDPRAMLELLHRSAPPDARLFIATSCLDNWPEMPPGGLEGYILRLAHTYTFTRQALERLLEATGWEVVRRASAEKGDQWVLARRADGPRDAEVEDPAHHDEVLGMIDAYRSRCRGGER